MYESNLEDDRIRCFNEGIRMKQRVKKLRSLRQLMFWAVCLSIVIFVSIFFIITQTVTGTILLRSEQEHFERMHDVVKGIWKNAELSREILAKDIGLWEETVEFVHGNRPDYLSNWVGESILLYNRHDFLMIKDVGGRDVYTEFSDRVLSQISADVPNLSAHLNNASLKMLSDYAPSTSDENMGAHGTFMMNGNAYAVHIIPIIMPELGMPPAGAVIVGDLISNNYMRTLTHFYDIDFLIRETNAQMPVAISQVKSSDEYLTTNIALFPLDANHAPDSLFLEMNLYRSIFVQGKRYINLTNIVLLVLAVVFVALIYALTARYLIGPIERLSRSLSNISSGSMLDTSDYCSSTELHTLSVEINEMIHRVETTEYQMIQSTESIDLVRGILDGVDALLCVTDLETDEFLYINEKMRHHYGLEREIIGEKCWRILQKDMTGRCSFCPVTTLLADPSAVVSWEYTSCINGKSYRNTDCLIDWTEGKKVHMQHSIDITDMKRAEQTLSRQLAQQQLMSDISQSFISTDDKVTLINNALRMAGTFMNLSKVSLFHLLTDTDPGIGQIDYEWCDVAAGVTPTPTNVDLRFSKHATIYKMLVKNHAPFITQKELGASDELSPLRDPRVKVFISVPIFIEGKLWGIISFNDHHADREWTEGDTQLVRMIASIISGVILRAHTETVLLRMSSVAESSP